jgi:hypothetical protein
MAYINEKGQEVLSSETRVIRVPFTSRELTVFDRVRIALEERYAAEFGGYESEEDENDFGSESDFDDDMTVRETAAQFYDRVMMEPDPPREPAPKSEQEPSEKEPEATE